MAELSRSFSQSYGEARERFLAAAASAGAAVTSIEHPLRGPDGGRLFMDFAVLGPEEAESGLLLSSGTHGPEAYAGSGVQVELLSSPEELAKLGDLRLVLLHGHNPYGWAWHRRVNEDNIDLNRNYCRFDEPYGCNERYETVRELFLPDDFTEESTAAIHAWIAEHGEKEFATVALQGQRVDPDGIFYGGHEPTWSHRTVKRELPRLFRLQRRALLIDFHTGVGGFGEGTILHVYPAGSERAQLYDVWFEGKVAGEMEEVDYDQVDLENTGSFMGAFDFLLPDLDTYSLVVEYGTVGVQGALFALIEDNWLHARGDLESEKGRRIKKGDARSAVREHPGLVRGGVGSRALADRSRGCGYPNALVERRLDSTGETERSAHARSDHSRRLRPRWSRKPRL